MVWSMRVTMRSLFSSTPNRAGSPATIPIILFGSPDPDVHGSRSVSDGCERRCNRVCGARRIPSVQLPVLQQVLVVVDDFVQRDQHAQQVCQLFKDGLRIGPANASLETDGEPRWVRPGPGGTTASVGASPRRFRTAQCTLRTSRPTALRPDGVKSAPSCCIMFSTTA